MYQTSNLIGWQEKGAQEEKGKLVVFKCTLHML